MWFLLLWIMGIISGAVHLFIIGWPHDPSEIARIFLLHQFVVTFGLVGIIGAVVNIVIADKTAESLGWPGGPFQIKYGFSQLGLGIMGVLAIWFHGNFWVGVLVTMYIYGLSGLWSHIHEMIRKKKLIFNDVGNIVLDVLYQTFITLLSIWAGGIWISG